MKTKYLLIGLFLLIALLSRFVFLVDGISQLPNFSAIGALILFSASYLNSFKKFLLPLGLLWFSDLILNNLVYSKYFTHFQLFSDPWVMLSYFLCILLAIYFLRKPDWTRLFSSAIATAVVFYLVSNFAVWMNGTMYPKTISGLGQCYLVAIPFFRNAILGNLVYGFLFFGIYEYAASRSHEIKSNFALPSFLIKKS